MYASLYGSIEMPSVQGGIAGANGQWQFARLFAYTGDSHFSRCDTMHTSWTADRRVSVDTNVAPIVQWTNARRTLVAEANHSSAEFAMHNDLLDVLPSDVASHWAAEQRYKKRRKRKTFILLIWANIIAGAILAALIVISAYHGKGTSTDGNKPTNNGTSDRHVSEHCRKIMNTSGWKEVAINTMVNMDPTVEPCTDFFQYACEGWAKRHPLKPDQSSYTVYDDVASRLRQQIKLSIMAISRHTQVKALAKLKYAFGSCKDLELLDSLQGRPLWKLFEDVKNPIGSWPLLGHSITPGTNWTDVDVESRIGYLKSVYGVDSVIFAYVRPDDSDSSRYALELSGSMLPLGIGMFKTGYYLNDTKYGWIMNAYTNMIEGTVNSLKRELSHHEPTNRSEIEELVNFERKLAAIITSVKDEVDYAWNMNTLKRNIPSFNWTSFFNAMLSSELSEYNSLPHDLILRVTPSFLAAVSDLLRNSSKVTVQNYLIWRLVRYSMPFMGKEYRNLLATFEGIMRGKRFDESEQRTETCVSFVNGRNHLPGLGYATGRAYVDYTFADEDRDNVEEVTELIRLAYKGIIEKVQWLDRKTRRRAAAKVDLMRRNVGFPRWIRNNDLLDKYYERLEFSDQESAFSLNLLTRSWSVKENFRLLLHATVRSDDFGGSPTATNAWYNPLLNSITLPAGEIQPPFYKADYPKAVIFGTLGSIIGHEMTHAFDRIGSLYDEYGNEVNWWSTESKSRFKNATECLVRDYAQYCFQELRTCINGRATLNENLADLGGLTVAHTAYKLWKSRHDGDEPGLPLLDISTDQLFFLSFASFWCGQTNDKTLRSQLQTATHSPGKYRVIGPLRNYAPFARAFNCPDDSYMNRLQRCNLWPSP
ncbi:peptidase family M13 [Trichuris suis]|nr:peptidase family M13 [Trichuris suis]